MKLILTSLLALGIVFLTGCCKEADVTASAEYKALLQASGGAYFERKLPEDLKSTDWIYIALAYPNGEKKQILGMSEQKVEFTSDTVKIYFFEEKYSDYPFIAMQVSDNTMGHGATEHASKKNWKAKTEERKHGEFSDPMIRFSTNNSISSIGGTEIPEGCFDLILYIDPNQPKS
jgi:hypothetical protein